MRPRTPAPDPSNRHYQRLLSFRASHEPRSLEVGGMLWRYIAAGSGDAVLALPGALRRADSVFDTVLDLEATHRVVSVEYPLAPTMAELLGGIRQILRHESIDKAAVIGRSFGGVVAQCLVRAHPEVVSRLALCHTSVPAGEEQIKRARQVRRFLSLLPGALAVRIVLHALEQIMTSGTTEESAAFWRWYLAELPSSGFGKAEVLNHLELGIDAAGRYSFAPGTLDAWPGPILLVLAEDDVSVPPPIREELERTYPRARLKLFADGGHTAAHRHPEEYRAVIEQFLSA